MGAEIALALIDHECIVVQGLPVVNAALRQNNPEILREYLATIPVDVDSSIVTLHKERLARLRDFNAPETVIEIEERLLESATGESYRPEAFREATFDQLRGLLGNWCAASRSYSLDKAWSELHWFLQPGAGTGYSLLDTWLPKVGDPDQTVLSKALQGAVHYPTDDLGKPLFGEPGPYALGYNPPETCQVILDALQNVEPAAWRDHVPFRSTLYRRECPDMSNEEIARRVENDLSFAKEAFPVLLSAYTKAVDKAYGVSCSYSSL
jgi:hypothetical protein